MARPVKFGLDYFSVDVNNFSKLEIRKLIRFHHGDGIAVYFAVLCDIFQNGYYLEINSDYIFDFSDRLKIDIESAEQIIRDMVSYGLFDKGLYKTKSILTSKDIQQRYFIAKGKMDKRFISEMPYVLIENLSCLESSSYITDSKINTNNEKSNEGIVSELTPVNRETSAQRKEKKIESKDKTKEEKKEKEKKIKINFERKSRSLNAHECAEEGERESFRNKIRFLIFSLLEDKEWCRAACAFSSDPQEYEKHLKDKLQKYYDYIILVGGEKSLNDIEDYKRRFLFWQRDHDSINESDSLTEKKEKVPPATKVSKVEAARLLEQQAIEMVTQKLSENV